MQQTGQPIQMGVCRNSLLGRVTGSGLDISVQPRLSPVATDLAIARLSSINHGPFTSADAIAQGVQARALTRRIASGRLSEVLPGVLCPASLPLSPNLKVAAASTYIGSEGALSGRTALWLFGLGPAPARLSAIARSPRCPGVDWLQIHRADLSSPLDTEQIGHLRVTSVSRTLLDLSLELPVQELADTIDEARRKRLVSLARLQWYLTRRGRKHGVAKLLPLVEERLGEAMTESRLEDRALRLMRRAGLPPPERQYVVRDEAHRTIGRMDFAYPEQKVIVECDSYAHHSARSAFERDRTRWNRIQGQGWRVVWATWDSTSGRGTAFIRELRAALEHFAASKRP